MYPQGNHGASYASSRADATVAPPELLNARLDRQAELLDILAKSVEQLAMRLDPVLTPDGMDAGHRDDASALKCANLPVSPCAGMIDRNTTAINAAMLRINGLVNRLEV